MFRIIFTFLIFTSKLCFSQEHRTLFQSEAIKQNKVFKVLEYNPEDSLSFFEQYPEGYYSKFDKLGRITESNNYSPYESEGVWKPSMFKNYYLYDSLDNQIAFIQIHDEMECPFRFLEVSSFNESDTINLAWLKVSYQINSEFIFETKQKPKKLNFWGDTLKITKRHFCLTALNDSSMTMDIYYDKNGLKDSTIFKSIGSGLNGTFKTETITSYDYYKNGNLRTVVVKRFNLKNGSELYSIQEYYFLENELLDKIRTYYTINKMWDVRQFKYFTRTENGTN